MRTKQEIRRYIKEAVKAGTASELAGMSDDVCRKILGRVLREGKSPMLILLYWSLPDEVQTPALIERLHQLGHRVLLPVVTGNTIQLAEYSDTAGMTTGAFDIQEPVGEAFDNYDEIDLAFIPGRAFTTGGARLGRGKGYYDRLLTQMRCPLIGVCFPFQIVEEIPMETHDIMLNEVIY